MPLANDIQAKIRKDFSGETMLTVIEALERLQQEDERLFCDRILRCILFVACGDPNAFDAAVSQARIDFRDLIVQAEYDGHFGSQQRVLSKPFTG